MAMCRLYLLYIMDPTTGKVLNVEDKIFKIQGCSFIDSVSIDRLKPVLLSSPVTSSALPRSVRPRRVLADSALPSPPHRPRGHPRKTPTENLAPPSRLRRAIAAGREVYAVANHH